MVESGMASSLAHLHSMKSSVRSCGIGNYLQDGNFRMYAHLNPPATFGVKPMEFGVSVGHISAVDFAQHGERLGFTRCWVT
jgi:hypothetical protein